MKQLKKYLTFIKLYKKRNTSRHSLKDKSFKIFLQNKEFIKYSDKFIMTSQYSHTKFFHKPHKLRLITFTRHSNFTC